MSFICLQPFDFDFNFMKEYPFQVFIGCIDEFPIHLGKSCHLIIGVQDIWQSMTYFKWHDEWDSKTTNDTLLLQ